MRLMILLMAIAIVSTGSLSAQSFFKPVPKVASHPALVRGAYGVIGPDQPLPTPGTDSSVNAFRPIANLAAYAEPGDVLMAGAGVSYQHLTWNVASQKWYCPYSISALAFAGGSVAPNMPSQIARVGVMIGVWNNKIMIGPATDGKRVMAVVGLGVSFNN